MSPLIAAGHPCCGAIGREKVGGREAESKADDGEPHQRCHAGGAARCTLDSARTLSLSFLLSFPLAPYTLLFSRLPASNGGWT